MTTGQYSVQYSTVDTPLDSVEDSVEGGACKSWTNRFLAGRKFVNHGKKKKRDKRGEERKSHGAADTTGHEMIKVLPPHGGEKRR